MAEDRFVGILKFFADEYKLDALLGGTFYCNTPEYYRLSGDEGISDRNESCTHSYRMSRGEEPAKLFVEGHELKGITALTLHAGGIKDKWLHCWFSLDMPASNEELENLVADLRRVRREFGQSYAFVAKNDIEELVRRVEQESSEAMSYGKIRYSADSLEWSGACKSIDYSYQREFRFALGDCGHEVTEPRILKCAEGFQDIVKKNANIKIEDEASEDTLFYMDSLECYCNTDDS